VLFRISVRRGKKKEGVAKVQPKDMKNKKKENKVAEGMQEKEVLF